MWGPAPTVAAALFWGGRRKHEHQVTEYTRAGPPEEPWKCVPVPSTSLYGSLLGILPEARACIAGASPKKLLLSGDCPQPECTRSYPRVSSSHARPRQGTLEIPVLMDYIHHCERSV